jgi:hypothetical protein
MNVRELSTGDESHLLSIWWGLYKLYSDLDIGIFGVQFFSSWRQITYSSIYPRPEMCEISTNMDMALNGCEKK